ncbi:MAG: HAMP domain-containing protein [Desulfobacteraceae bacterium]|nr:HAMP domain-containing protein [Desulfobacteraceae bacterium]
MRKRILKCFAVIILILVGIGTTNLIFFLRINSAFNEIVENRFQVDQRVQQGHLLISQIHNNIWEAMLFDPKSRKAQIETLDAEALDFYRIMDDLDRLLPEENPGLTRLRRHFQNFFLIGKEILQIPDLATFQNSSDDIREFRRQKTQLGDLIDTTFNAYKLSFIDSLNQARQHAYWLSFVSGIVVLFGVLNSVFFSFRLSDTLVRPIINLTDTVKAFTKGNLTVKAGHGGDDEIGRLGAAFNLMTDRLSASMEKLKTEIKERKRAEKKAKHRQKQLVQADKMASLGILTAGVAHEINNPNQFIMSHVAPLEQAWVGAVPILNQYHDQFGDFRCGGSNYSVIRDRIPSVFANIRKGSERIRSIVNELHQFAGDRSDELAEHLNLNQVITSALTLVTAMIKASTDRFTLEFQGDIPSLVGHYQRLEQVVVNLVQNACHALTAKTQVIRIKTFYRKSDGKIILEVRDEGKGIDPENLNRVTDPFFTTKRDQGGTGLGLSISSRIIMEHGGTMDFYSHNAAGTTVLVALPPVPIAGERLKPIPQPRETSEPEGSRRPH